MNKHPHHNPLALSTGTIPCQSPWSGCCYIARCKTFGTATRTKASFTSYWRAEQERLEAERIAVQESYQKVSFAFCIVSGREYRGETEGIYMSFGAAEERNVYGISTNAYFFLKTYEQETGIVLPYDMVVEYLSEELNQTAASPVTSGPHFHIQKLHIPIIIE